MTIHTTDTQLSFIPFINYAELKISYHKKIKYALIKNLSKEEWYLWKIISIQ